MRPLRSLHGAQLEIIAIAKSWPECNFRWLPVALQDTHRRLTRPQFHLCIHTRTHTHTHTHTQAQAHTHTHIQAGIAHAQNFSTWGASRLVLEQGKLYPSHRLTNTEQLNHISEWVAFTVILVNFFTVLIFCKLVCETLYSLKGLKGKKLMKTVAESLTLTI